MFSYLPLALAGSALCTGHAHANNPLALQTARDAYGKAIDSFFEYKQSFMFR